MNVGEKGEKIGRLVLIDSIYIMADNLSQPVKKPSTFPSLKELNEQIESLDDIDDLTAYNFFAGMMKWLELQVTQAKANFMGFEASFRALMCLTMGSLMYESFLVDASENKLDPKQFERMESFNFFQVSTFDENAKTIKDFKASFEEFTVFYKAIVNYNEVITALKEVTGIKEFNKIILNTKKIGTIDRYNQLRNFYDELIFTETNKDKREKLERLVTKELLPELPTKRTLSNKKNIAVFKARVLQDPELFRHPLEIQKILKG